MEHAEELIRDLQKGLLHWYDFKTDAKALYVGKIQDPLAEMLIYKGLDLLCIPCVRLNDPEWDMRHQNWFDYIICVETLEEQEKPEAHLCSWKKLLKSDGRLLLGMNNRLGFRYFCGDRDPYTERNFDGIDGYRNFMLKNKDEFTGRCYHYAELSRMLTGAGWKYYHFYSVFPDLKNPVQIYEENYQPKEDLANRVLAAYNYPKSVFLEEECLYQSLIENGLFHKMANSYLIECSLDGNLSDVCHVTATMDRGRKRSLLTIIHSSGNVEKRAAYPEGRERLVKLLEHGKDLAAHGIQVVDAKLQNGVYIMPYMDYEIGQVHLKRTLMSDKKKFLQEMDHLRDLVLQSSEIIKPDIGDGMGAVLRKGYLEMVPLNSFYKEETFVFYDQEYCMDNYPANAIIARLIATFYAGNDELEKVLPSGELYERYGLTENLWKWRSMERDFLTDLRKDKVLQTYHKKHHRDGTIVRANRQRINFAADDYDKLFTDIFDDADTRKLIIFGSGSYAERFIALYGCDYPVYAILDNNNEKWGKKLGNIQIHAPKFLRRFDSAEYKVLICIRDYMPVIRQLEDMGIIMYSVFDPCRSYQGKRRPALYSRHSETPKKYHIGYIAGDFDLFHIGHLNMFRKAKEQCDYLIAGVVTDEGVRRFKREEPFIPYEERVELVRSCRYVDEVVEIPLMYEDTENAWKIHRFDVQFLGSDYINDQRWLEKKEFLEKHGAEMAFLSYTETTSSTKIKPLIEQKIL